MRILKLNEILNFDINISRVTCTHQNWSSKHHTWNNIDFSRPGDGFIYVSYGSAEYTDTDGRSITANSGDILYLPKGSRYFVKFDPVCSRSMVINFVLSCGNDDIILSDKIFIAAQDKNNMLYETFDDLCTVYPRTTDKLIIKSKLFAILSELSVFNSYAENPSLINTALVYINNHLNDVADIPMIAKMCMMSESTFRREFSRIAGCGPKKYINEQKIKKARQMLSRSELSISEICSALGFYDGAYFTKIFKEITGETPAAYRHKRLAE